MRPTTAALLLIDGETGRSAWVTEAELIRRVRALDRRAGLSY